MPIDDDYVDELIRRWTASVRAIPVKDWSNDDYRSRVERLRRLRRRNLVVLSVSVAAGTFAIVFAILVLLG